MPRNTKNFAENVQRNWPITSTMQNIPSKCPNCCYFLWVPRETTCFQCWNLFFSGSIISSRRRKRRRRKKYQQHICNTIFFHFVTLQNNSKEQSIVDVENYCVLMSYLVLSVQFGVKLNSVRFQLSCLFLSFLFVSDCFHLRQNWETNHNLEENEINCQL